MQSDSQPPQTPWRHWSQRLWWPLLYVATVTGLLWWYEFRPARHAHQQLQGAWRQVVGAPPNSQELQTLFHVEGDQAWLLYPRDDEWQAIRSRISIQQADNFFTVRRAIGFDYGTTRETEYVVCLKEDRIYILRGIATLAPETTPSVDKFVLERDPPAAALDAIRNYLERRAADIEND